MKTDSVCNEFKVAVIGVAAIIALGLTFLPVPAHSQVEWGHKNAVYHLGTQTSGVESNYIGTGNTRAAADSYLASVFISSASSGVSFQIYDSSTSVLTNRRLIAGILCSTIGYYPIQQTAQYGLYFVNNGCTATVSYLTHK